MTTETIARRVLAASPSLELREAAVVAVPVDGDPFHAGRTYTKAAAFGQATRIMNANEAVNAYVVYRHTAGTTVYISKSTVLYTEAVA